MTADRLAMFDSTTVYAGVIMMVLHISLRHLHAPAASGHMQYCDTTD